MRKMYTRRRGNDYLKDLQQKVEKELVQAGNTPSDSLRKSFQHRGELLYHNAKEI